MSAVQAPQGAGQQPAAPTRLRAIPSRSQRLARLPFMLIVAGLLGGGMAGVVLLSTTIQSQSAELGDLQAQRVQLSQQQAALVAEVQDLRSSQNLANRAWGLGMRPNPHPAFVRMPDGAVLGVPSPVTGDELPGMVPPQPAASSVSTSQAPAPGQPGSPVTGTPMPAGTTQPTASQEPR